LELLVGIVFLFFVAGVGVASGGPALEVDGVSLLAAFFFV
jgi:hypothetical protein